MLPPGFPISEILAIPYEVCPVSHVALLNYSWDPWDPCQVQEPSKQLPREPIGIRVLLVENCVTC